MVERYWLGESVFGKWIFFWECEEEFVEVVGVVVDVWECLIECSVEDIFYLLFYEFFFWVLMYLIV